MGDRTAVLYYLGIFFKLQISDVFKKSSSKNSLCSCTRTAIASHSDVTLEFATTPWTQFCSPWNFCCLAHIRWENLMQGKPVLILFFLCHHTSKRKATLHRLSEQKKRSAVSMKVKHYFYSLCKNDLLPYKQWNISALTKISLQNIPTHRKEKKRLKKKT